ncbi:MULTISPECIES: histidine phosphatase family protein [Deefgea]|uniref:Histidine phosphatase family protein n=1 Tax=Deefgea chitinilytica TaxID=570276 RepID=A0ABS2C9F5_9NEIS|nr:MULTISPECIES: histidine phosphatase family protein [Deefgea]MBM5570778.1 histidine phosphatase family protein [Deefgea chitinilytica]MBM9888007.1 histidine phosphatase family protein [Deefgea sp. CFH1-16]
MSRIIYLLRHGQTEFNLERRMQGHCDSPLTELGKSQARAMGATLSALLSEPQRWHVLASPLGRAQHTAKLVLSELGLPEQHLQIDHRLIEVAFGEWEQQQVLALFDQYPELATQADWYFQAPACEPLAAVTTRLKAWLNDPALPQYVVVVAHGLLGRILRGIYARLTAEQMWQQDMPQDALFRLQDGQITRIECRQLVE